MSLELVLSSDCPHGRNPVWESRTVLANVCSFYNNGIYSAGYRPSPPKHPLRPVSLLLGPRTFSAAEPTGLPGIKEKVGMSNGVVFKWFHCLGTQPLHASPWTVISRGSRKPLALLKIAHGSSGLAHRQSLAKSGWMMPSQVHGPWKGR